MNLKKTSERIEAASLEYHKRTTSGITSWSMVEKKKKVANLMAIKYNLNPRFFIELLSSGFSWDVKEELIRKK